MQARAQAQGRGRAGGRQGPGAAASQADRHTSLDREFPKDRSGELNHVPRATRRPCTASIHAYPCIPCVRIWCATRAQLWAEGMLRWSVLPMSPITCRTTSFALTPLRSSPETNKQTHPCVPRTGAALLNPARGVGPGGGHIGTLREPDATDTGKRVGAQQMGRTCGRLHSLTRTPWHGVV